MTRAAWASLVVLGIAFGCSGDDGADGVAGPDGGKAGADGSAGLAGSGGGWPGGSGGSSGGTGGTTSGGTGGTVSGGTGGAVSGGGGTPTGGTGGVDAGCPLGTGGSGGPCEFPQGVPDPDFICSAASYQDTDPSVDAAVNAAMAKLTGCGVMSDCDLSSYAGATAGDKCQSFFAAVTQELRAQGYCAGQHAVGSTDEIAVSKTGCVGKWYGYHVCFYGGPKVVWNPGARRGWWVIKPSYCK